MTFTLFGLKVFPALFALGLIQGMTYGILAVGLILVYRSSKVINFAHGQIGAFGAAICGLAVVKWNFPYWIAFVLALVVSAGSGSLAEVAVVRRLRKAPKIMSLVATLGVASFLLAFSAVVNGSVSSGSTFPQPPGMPQFHIGVLLVTRAYSAMLLLSPLIVIALVLFLRYTRYGLAIRAASANEERARMVGISAARMSTLAWALAGAVAAFTTVLIIPTRGFLTAEILGPTLLLRALVPAVIGRMTNMPTALGAGVVIGVIDQILIYNYPTSGVPEVVLLAIILLALLVQSPRGSRVESREDWSLLQPWGSLPEAFEKVWAIRNLGRVVGLAGLALAVAVGLFGSNATAVTMVAIVAFSLLGLSVAVLTGLGGQLSLGQFALAGVGAAVSYAATRHTNFIFAIALAGLVVGVLSVVIGIPALRIRGPLLGVITLSFALAAKRWLLAQSFALGDGVNPGRPHLGPISLDLTKRYYLFSLVVLAAAYWLARNVWKGGIGLRLRAQRDNEDGARAFSVPTTLVKLQGFLVAGLLAGMGGALYGHLLARISADGFDVVTSINVVAIAVLGGVGVLFGPVLGALYIIGIPRFMPLDSAGVAATSLGWLLLILYFPGGIAQMLATPRTRIIDFLARRAGLDPVAVRAGTVADDDAFASAGSVLTAESRAMAHVSTDSSAEVLAVSGVSKQFGGVQAVDNVDLTAGAGEIVGIIGPNGAGKTTLFELLSGFTVPDAGTVVFQGEDVSRCTPDERARRGLIRSFQDPLLFPTLTVTEALTLSLERAVPTRFVPSMFGLQRAERDKQAVARELVALMGLEPYRAKQVRELSTGTRRITELACIVALQPTVLLLDEPSSGIAQRESEALGELLLRLRDHLGATFLVIEHDIPLLMGLSDRVIAMDSGRVIAEGLPKAVRNHPAVVESYLGGDVRAIERSGLHVAGATTNGAAHRCTATTRRGDRCTRLAADGETCTQHARAAVG
jgi:ABC-type branched-subunit amino acid transport system ATPase component/ABC-type branched-subunit amino acid transport system permease subunit